MNLRHISEDVAEVHRLFRELPFDFAADLMEAVISSTYRNWLCEGDTAVDMGACVGRHTLPMAGAVGSNGLVFAFEAVPATARVLRRNLVPCADKVAVQIQELALSNYHGTSKFFFAEQMPGWSGLRKYVKYARETAIQELDIPVRTLDEVLADRAKPVEFIKSDLEGGDLHALQGGRGILTKDRPLIALEANVLNASKRYGYEPSEFYGFFEEIGYGLVDAFGGQVVPENWNQPQPWYMFAYPQEREQNAVSAITVAVAMELLRFVRPATT